MKRTVQITHIIEIEVDESKFTENFIEAYSKHFFPYYDIETHMENIVNYFAQFDEPYKSHFLEGYGPIDEMGIKLKWLDTESEMLE